MKKIDWEAANAICERLSPEQDALVRTVVTQISEKWTLWTMSVLTEPVRRFASHG